ncbi:MAG: hypothetical protein HRU11_02255 [Parvularculaceae bacterium]|nr:hypothetical protein [Parvularculaceae bacterium]
MLAALAAGVVAAVPFAFTTVPMFTVAALPITVAFAFVLGLPAGLVLVRFFPQPPFWMGALGGAIVGGAPWLIVLLWNGGQGSSEWEIIMGFGFCGLLGGLAAWSVWTATAERAEFQE